MARITHIVIQRTKFYQQSSDIAPSNFIWSFILRGAVVAVLPSTSVLNTFDQ
jgi:hypothetical protein